MASEHSVPPTISEVAAAAGVGRSTAARTLGGYGYVSPELRERVLAAAERLGYRANALARSMSTGVTQTLGVIVADIANPFFGGVVRGISDASRARGFQTLVLSTHEDLAEEIAATDVLIDKRVDGIIVASAALDVASAGHIGQARDRGIPVVLVDRAVTGLLLDTVVIDNRAAARDAVAQLIAAGLSVDEIAKSIGADSLAYLSLEGLIQATHVPKDNLCRACFDGVYPVQVPHGVEPMLTDSPTMTAEPMQETLPEEDPVPSESGPALSREGQGDQS